MNKKQKKYDQELSTCEVAYNPERDGFICSYCKDSFTISQMDCIIGGGLVPVTLEDCEQTLRFLRKEICLLCELPVSRSFD